MPTTSTLVAALLLLAASAPLAAQESDPRAVRRAALRAVEGDSAPILAARWRAHLVTGATGVKEATDRAATLGLASIAGLRYDYSTAERLYRSLADDTSRPDVYAVHALLGLGWSAMQSGRFPQAEAIFARARIAARAATAHGAEAEAILGTTHALGLRSPPLSLALLDSAVRLLPTDDLALRSAIGAQRANVLASTSDPRAAAEARVARTLAIAAGEPRQEALALYAAAINHRLRHETDSALMTYREVQERQRRLRDHAALANTLVSTADLLFQDEELIEARRVLRSAQIEAVTSGNRRAMTRVNVGLGSVAMSLGDYATAATHFAQAVANAGSLGDTSSLATARAFHSQLLLATGEFNRARAASAWALAYFRRSQRWYETVLVTQHLAAVERHAGRYDAAERLLLDADTTARRHQLAFVAERLASDRGQLAFARGRYAEARVLFAQLLPQLGENETVTRYSTKLRIAHIDAELGRTDVAVRGVEQAAAEFERWREGLSDREQRLLVFQTSSEEEGNLDAAIAGAIAALASSGRVDGAFRVAEQRRARMLAERVIRAQVLAAAATPAPAPRARPTADMQALASALLDERTALLEYVTGGWGSPTTLFVLRLSGGQAVVRAFRIPAADSVAGTVHRLVALLEGGGDPGALARALGAALLDSAVATLGPRVTRLIVVPDGILHRVPFDALRLADGRYVVERYAVGITPSVTVLATIRERRPSRGADAPSRLLAFGDPAFTSPPRGSADAEYRSAFDSTGGLPRLVASGREARLVARYADAAVVRLRGEASAAYLRHSPLSAFSVLHFATHALVDDRSREHTALALAPSGADGGFVNGNDLAALRLQADLVVLSACRSAGGQLVRGEGILGLTAPLIEAGARAVVATAWRIKDRETIDFVRAFYDALAAGNPVADALRAAKLDAIQRGAPPAEWAAFQVVGDPLVRVSLRTPRPTWLWPAAVIVLLVAAGSLFYGARRVRARAAERRLAPA